MARWCLAFFLFLSLWSCDVIPPDVERYYGICKKKTEWCVEIVSIMRRIGEAKTAERMDTACVEHRTACSDLIELDMGRWDYLNDMLKISPGSIFRLYPDGQ